jgi:uncharacterized protein (DUF2235 family)
MSKNIIICLDGTWNKPDEPDAEIEKDTNVRNLYELCVSDSTNQIAYYDEGVGSHWYDKIRGGVSGHGLSKNIREAYYEIARQYKSNGNDIDKVFIFGFSRGAYTARSLAGMIYSCGLLEKDKLNEKNIEQAFDVYKKGDKQERTEYKDLNIKCPIHMLGVWDTVGALGIPVSFFKKFTNKFLQFHDTKLNKEIKSAYHAIAIDEQRETFKPSLWDMSNKKDNQTIEQAWFAGVHSDIGGGYPERHHSDIAFKWMLDKAKDQGIMIHDNHGYEFKPDLTKEIHDSYKKYYGSKERRVASISEDYTPKVHRSVQDKLDKKPGYNPLALVDRESAAPASLKPYEIVE